MKKYIELPLTQRLLQDFRDEMRTLRNPRTQGQPVGFELFESYLEEHPEYVTFYIDLFNISEDELEKEILGTIIVNKCRYTPVEEYLKMLKRNPWPDRYFHDDSEYVLSSKEINRLMSLPKDQRLSYDPEDEIVVKERLDYFDKQYEEREKQEAEKAKSLNKEKK